MDPKCFIVGISRVQDYFSWVFRGSKVFSRGYFMGLKFFSRGYFVGPKFFVRGMGEEGAVGQT